MRTRQHIHEIARACLHRIEEATGGRATPREIEGVAERPKDAAGEDGAFRLTGPWGEIHYAYEARPWLTGGALALAQARLARIRRRGVRPLLLARHVPAPMADRLRAAGVQFFDTAGNGFLDAPGLRVWIVGRRVEAPPFAPRRLDRPAGLRLLFAILKDPTLLGRPHRTIAAAAGIAVGGVGAALDALEAEGLVRRVGRRTRRVERPEEAIDRFAAGWAATLRPRLVAHVCRQAHGNGVDDLHERVLAAGLRDAILLGGELGAALATGGVRPVTAALHLVPGPAEGREQTPIDVMRALDLVPAPDGPVAIVRPLGPRDAADPTAPDAARLADPLLLYAEVLALPPDRRLVELADAVRTRHVLPRLAP